MKPTARKLRIPKALVVTTLGCVLACSSTSPDPGPLPDAATADALPDGCIYQLCNGPSGNPTCPGAVCLVPPEQCPPGCEPIV
jgi:hypothetical protein